MKFSLERKFSISVQWNLRYVLQGGLRSYKCALANSSQNVERRLLEHTLIYYK